MSEVFTLNATNFASSNVGSSVLWLKENEAGEEAIEDEVFRVIRSAKQKCPPVKVNKGFSPFAFLAFILISVNTIINISNNISNNNNNRNNNNVSKKTKKKQTKNQFLVFAQMMYSGMLS